MSNKRLVVFTLLAIIFALMTFAQTDGPANAAVLCNGAAGSLPGGSPGPLDITCVISGQTGSISDINVSVTATVSFSLNRLNLELISPLGTTIDLVRSECGINNGFNNVTFDDEAATPITSCPTGGQITITGTFSPEEPLSSFDGESPNGTWILRISRSVDQSETLAVQAWSLDVTQAGGLPDPSVSFVETNVTENGGPTLNVQVITADSNPVPNDGITRTVQVVLDGYSGGGSANKGSDYDFTGGVNVFTINVPNGTASGTLFPFGAIIDDAVLERTENIILEFQNPTNLTASAATHTITIAEDETGRVEFTLAASSTTEFGSPLHNIIVQLVPISSDGVASIGLSINGTVGNAGGGTATQGGDNGTCPNGDWFFPLVGYYTANRFFLNSGNSTYITQVRICDDAVPEGPETAILNLALNNPPPNVSVSGQVNHTVTINEQPGAAINDVTQSESTSPFNFTVTLSENAGAGGVTVNYTTATGGGNPATSGVDFTAATSSVNIAAGNNTATIPITVISDTLVEGNETFFVNLTGISGTNGGGTAFIISDNQGIGTINNDDTEFNTFLFDPDPTNEGSGGGVTVFSFRINRNGDRSQAQSVDFTITAGTATGGGVDFTEVSPNPLTVNFAPTVSFQNVLVNVVADNTDEADEDFTYGLSNATGGATIQAASVSRTGIIIDDDNPTLAINDITVNENVGLATFTVTLTGSTPFPVSVQFNSNNGTVPNPAVDPNDFTDVTGTLNFVGFDGETQTIDVPIIDDNIDENDENFRVNLFNAINANITDGLGVATIQDNDTAEIVIDDVTVNEGDGNAVFTVSLTSEALVNVTVDYDTADNTAVAPGDYTTTSNSLLFTPGQTTRLVSVPIIDDPTSEPPPPETFFVNLTNPTGAPIADAQGVGTIIDNEQPTFIIDDVSENENNGTITFTVTRGGVTTDQVTVDFATANDVALAGSDYTANTNTLNFGVGVLTQPVVINITNDNDVELDETFFVNLSNAVNITTPGVGAGIGDAQGVGTILDKDAATVAFSLANSAVDENVGGHTIDVQLTIPGGGVLGTTVSVVVDVIDAGGGSATSGADYTAFGTQMVTFPAGSASGATQSVTLTVTDDGLVEGPETVNLAINGVTSGASASASGQTTHQVTINDNDAATLAIDDVSLNEGNAATTAFTFTVTLTGDVPAGFSVDFDTADGTATTADSDYAANNNTLNFAGTSGETQTLTVDVNGDTTLENNETFFVDLSNIQAGGLNVTFSDAQGQGTIVNDDNALVDFVLANSTVGEAAGTHNVDVVLTGLGAGTLPIAIDVQVSATGGTATNPADFTGTPQTVTFPIGSGNGATQSATLNIVNDTDVEGDETIDLGLAVTGGPAAVGATQPTHQVTITDNDNATVEFDLANSSTSEGVGTFNVNVRLNTPGGTISTPITVDVTDSLTGSANDPADYSGPTFNLTFPAGSGNGALQPAALTIVGDALVELDETIDLALANLAGTNVSLGTQQTHQLTINDDDAATLVIDDVSQAEGDTPTTITFTFTVTLDVAVNTGFSVDFLTADGTATIADTDYDVNSGTLNFAGTVGEMQTLGITVNGDDVVEADENFFVNLSNLLASGRNVTLADAQGEGTIQNDDSTTVQFELANSATVDESNGGFDVNLILNVPFGGTLPTAVTIDVNDLLTGSAISGVDYNFASPSTVTFPIGSPDGALQPATITIINDADPEGDETVDLQLNGASITGPATLGAQATHTVTITDDDGATVFFENRSSSVNETIPAHIVNVELNIPGGGVLGNPVTIDVIDILTGSATGAGVDYTFATQTVTFAVGAADGDLFPINVAIVDDLLTEGTETINLMLDAATLVGVNVAVGTRDEHRVRIIDDESPPPVGGGGATQNDDHVVVDDTPPCLLVDGTVNNIVRAMVPTSTVTDGAVFCRIINENGVFVQNPAELGTDILIGYGVLQAVDVFGLTENGNSVPNFNNNIEVCLLGSGFLHYLDATQAPRTLQLLATTQLGGFTCGTIPNAGTLVLTQATGGAAQQSSAPAPTSNTASSQTSVPLNGCRVTTNFIINLRSTPEIADGNIIRPIPFDTTYDATERTSAWFRIIVDNGQGWVSAGLVGTSGTCNP